ncbi:hypothetical protein AB0B89_31030 [Sphaerisporangium sp. NPDC049002]|uniref:hypothetical protein n=1 Tax=Sphaerisporangium sp. NPDC049002 TaxID=3155392 RepID=UPI0033E85E85
MNRSGIKRGTQPLARYKPLEGGQPPARRTRIKQVSAKRQRENRERARLVERLLKKYPLCERCRRAWSRDVHEPRKRSHGADILDPAECVCLCRACHDHVHDNPAESVADGWLIESHDKTTRPRAAAERAAAGAAWREQTQEAS